MFEETLPFMVHFMAIGATVVYKVMLPVLQAGGQIPEELRKGMGSEVSGLAAREIEKLILKAVRK